VTRRIFAILPGDFMRMETGQVSIRQQPDVTAAMATRLNRNETGRWWAQQARWRMDRPDHGWFGIPDRCLNDPSNRGPQMRGMS
jgi:hypothetical protein